MISPKIPDTRPTGGRQMIFFYSLGLHATDFISPYGIPAVAARVLNSRLSLM